MILSFFIHPAASGPVDKKKIIILNDSALYIMNNMLQSMEHDYSHYMLYKIRQTHLIDFYISYANQKLWH